jgi:two-component system sensor histidine kinase/response regulator
MKDQLTALSHQCALQNLTGGSILIVDDTPANLLLLAQVLTEYGYDIRAVSSGAQALAAIEANPPDLILLDIMMPGMDGFEVCERLKADASTRDIPIIFISVLDSTEDKVQAFDAGGVDYISKPFQIKEVLARVRTHVALQNLQKSLQQEIVRRDKLIAELDAYAHTVAHDLKNPVSSIIGLSNLLEHESDELPDEARRRFLRRIGQSGIKMHGIINELLLLASVREMQETPLQALDMARIVAQAHERLDYWIEQHQASVVLPPEHSWPVALGYGPWVEEVWVNYIGNALKYGGEPPRVELGFDASGHHSPRSEAEREWAVVGGQNTPPTNHQPPTTDKIRFWVRDNGLGLSFEEQGRLFTPFERLRHTRAEGYGLGLSIVRRIIEKLGGQVGVESQAGQGSVFFFTLPSVKQ